MAGHARVFNWNGSMWKIFGDDIEGEASDDNSSNSVTMSADGSVVAIGAYKNDPSGGLDAGHVRVFTFNDDFVYWNQLGKDIDSATTGDWTGLSLAWSANGQRLIVGAPGDSDRFLPGVSNVYDFVNSTWVQVGENLGGYSVGISNDGNRVAVGSPRGYENGPNSGHVLIYQYDDSSDIKLSLFWEQIPYFRERQVPCLEAKSPFPLTVPES